MLSVTITVNSADDSNTRDDVLTLREAILVSNGTLKVADLTANERAQVRDNPANKGANTIAFSIGDGGKKTIQVGAALPDITQAVIIDGTTQKGFEDTPLIELDGTKVPNPGNGNPPDGLTISAGGSTVKGLVINRFPLGGIHVTEKGENTIEGNVIGTDTLDTPKLGNGYGVIIEGASDNTITGNVISGNKSTGVYLIEDSGNNPKKNVVKDNYIGTTHDGMARLGNGSHGVRLSDAPENQIGPDNVISGNEFGITIDGGLLGIQASKSKNNEVFGNYIGTNKKSSSILGNTHYGVMIENASENIIGAGNIISENGNNPSDAGVILQADAEKNSVVGNFIGTDKTGRAARGNPGDGVLIMEASKNFIGPGNVISGNVWNGVEIIGKSDDNKIVGNNIGTDVLGLDGLGNRRTGVVVVKDIAGRFGVRDTILSNSIYANPRLGIDLNDDLVTPNDDECAPNDNDAGPNLLQNYPVLDSALAVGNSIQIAGSLNGDANTDFVIEFFGNEYQHPSLHGEGQVPLGSIVVHTDPFCKVGFTATFPLPKLPPGRVLRYIAATATDPVGNTSEFSMDVAADYSRFGSRSSYLLPPPSGTPFRVLLEDLNKDGLPDMAVTNYNAGSPTGTVSVLLNNPAKPGTYLPGVNYPVGAEPVGIAAGDFNHDGNLDLVVANSGSPFVSVLLGNGDGTFRPAQNYFVNGLPIDVAVGDFTGSGTLSLAVACQGSNSVNVLLGNGDGTFRPAGNYPLSGPPVAIAEGDFTGSGTLSLAVACQGSNSVNVLLGNGDGTLRPAGNYGTVGSPTSLAVGDFTNNGILSLAVACQGSNAVNLFLGNGNGAFRPAGIFPVGPNPFQVAVGDFDQDGNSDLVVTNFDPGCNTVTVLWGNGNGMFAPGTSYAAGDSPAGVAVADVNGNGLPDLAVTNAPATQQGSVSILLNLGNAPAPPPGASQPSPESRSAMASSPDPDILLEATASISALGVAEWLGRANHVRQAIAENACFMGGSPGRDDLRDIGPLQPAADRLGPTEWGRRITTARALAPAAVRWHRLGLESYFADQGEGLASFALPVWPQP